MRIMIGILLSMYALVAAAERRSDLDQPFPMDKYDQQIADWIKPEVPGYDDVITIKNPAMQKTLFEHFYGRHSPWSQEYITAILLQNAPGDIASLQKKYITGKRSEIGYKTCDSAPYTKDWYDNIESNLNLNQFAHLQYQGSNRAIAVKNLYARVLPTDDAFYHDCKLPGEGASFDYIQMSTVWAGTPLYVIGQSADGKWDLVASPDVVDWVKADGVASVTADFVKEWYKTVQREKGLAAITQSEVSIIDSQNNQPAFLGYVGMILPVQGLSPEADKMVLIPVLNPETQLAEIHHAMLSNNMAVTVPLSPTPRHFAQVMRNLIGRPYGWGNNNFNNDCSGELKSLYAPFGIYLPKYSGDQINPAKVPGVLEDYSSHTASERIEHLKASHHPFTTIINIRGHVFAYLGNYQNPVNQDNVALTYQNLWGLRPKPALIASGADQDRRSVIGKSVIFPLLEYYPEDLHLDSLANKAVFQLMYLDEINTSSVATPTMLISLPNSMGIKQVEQLDLRAMMIPEQAF